MRFLPEFCKINPYSCWAETMRQAAIAVLAFAYGAFAQPTDAAKSSEWFESTVKPVLRANCWACHSARNRTSGLALDSRDAVLAGGNRGPAVRPGQSAGSLLMAAVRHEGAVKMPPATRLKDEQVEVLRAWIDAGVPWSGTSAKIPGADHWAFQPIRRPAIPEVRNSAWTRNAIDRFIAALEAASELSITSLVEGCTSVTAGRGV